MSGVPTFPANDITPEVRAHMDRQEHWYRLHKGPMPRDWDGREVPGLLIRTREPSAPARDRAPRRERGTR